MLQQHLITLNAENRRSEKPQILLEILINKIGIEDYQSLIEWVFQISNELSLLTKTKCLARIYFDLTLTSSIHSDINGYVDLILACLSLAIKFNQMRSVADRLTPQVLFKAADLNFSRDYYLDLEIKIMTSIGFRLKYTTPEDFSDIFISRFPFFPRIRQALPLVIQFANIHVQSCGYSSQEVFFGAVLAICTTKQIAFTKFQENIFYKLTDCWIKAQKLSNLIVQELNQLNGQQNSN